ncbi:phosphate propanoyltransferase [Vagococcus sp.]|uniref:phosphate propanoyltransferase n=1 Tax=Vagococcus sp. TaxID=1933889 RepID=UPI003F974227
MKSKTEAKEVLSILANLKKYVKIPIGISNKHIHLSKKDFNLLFPNQSLNCLKELKQTGEFASDKVVTVIGPKGNLEKVRILGPFRQETQVELALTDTRQIGINAPIRMSGQLEGTPGVTLKSSFGEVELVRGAIVAKRHIHIPKEEAAFLNIKNNEIVKIKIETPERPLVFENCVVRVGENFVLEMHIDTDEANSAGIKSETFGKMI